MSIVITENSESLAGAVAPPNVDIGRTAFYLSSRQDPLLAWLHTAKDKLLVDHGVVICPPIGHEQVHSHRSLRRLADAIASRGIPTLRFDWNGTGDSAGCDADPSRVESWHANVRDLITWMRSGLGCRNVSVVGLRMGAMLAVEAIQPKDCENLVLWAPVVSGTSYVRQMQAIDQMAEVRPQHPSAAKGDIEAAGFVLSEQTAQGIAKSNLLQTPIHCSRALIVGPCDHRLSEHLIEVGIQVEHTSPPGYVEMMLEPHLSQIPKQAISEIADWLGQRIAIPSEKRLQVNLTDLGPSQTLLADRSQWTRPPACGILRERLFHRIGNLELFGVLSEPTKPSEEKPTIVILNAGSTQHVGPGRLHVELARHLAAHGFSSLRLDIRGLGESAGANDADNSPYPATVFHDVEATFEELRTHFGVKHFVLLGLCSGAYAAFQSAAQLADPSLVESILINPLTFYWRDGMLLDSASVERDIKEHASIARATNLSKLWKFLLGKTQISHFGALRLVLCRVQHYLKQVVAEKSEVKEWQPIAIPSHPKEENLSDDLQRIRASGRSLAMFLAEGDPGYTIMDFHAHSQMKKMQRAGRLYISSIASGDHTFSRRAPREKLFATIIGYLRKRYSGQASSS